jgi:hypothetical protein
MSHITDLPDMLSEIFFRGGLDTDLPDRTILQGVGGLQEFIFSAGRNGTRTAVIT